MWKKLVPAAAAVAALAVATEGVRKRRQRRTLAGRMTELAGRTGGKIARGAEAALEATRAPALAHRLGA